MRRRHRCSGFEGRSHERWVGCGQRPSSGGPRIPPLPGPPAPARSCRTHVRHSRAGNSAGLPPPGVTFAPPPFVHFTNQTLRRIVRTSVGGSRLVWSSAIRSAARRSRSAPPTSRFAKATTSFARQGRPFTFSGRPRSRFLPYGIVYSDPVALTVPPCRIWPSIIPARHHECAGTAQMQTSSFQTSYVSETGNHAARRSCRRLQPCAVGSCSRVLKSMSRRHRSHRHVRRLDYRRRRIDTRDEQPVARRARRRLSGVGDAPEDGYSQRRYWRQ